MQASFHMLSHYWMSEQFITQLSVAFTARPQGELQQAVVFMLLDIKFYIDWTSPGNSSEQQTCLSEK